MRTKLIPLLCPVQEPGMNKSRLAMLVDSLASGADVFTSNSLTETRGVNEMDVVMGNPTH
jgi:ribosome assembly protein 3